MGGVKRIVTVLALSAGLSGGLRGAETPVPLDPLVQRENLWQATGPEWVPEHRAMGFHWTSNTQDVAETTDPAITLFYIPVYQVLARFDATALKSLTVLFYNRGDAGTLRKEAFEELLKKCVDGLTTFTGSKPTVRGRDAANAVKAEGVEWRTGASRFLLEYSFTREVKTRAIPFRAEFVRLEITPLQQPKSLVAAALGAQKTTRFSGIKHVKKDPGGDVLIDGITMVDQGAKGYCVVASAERVLRYYGSQVDAHELAQIANSSAEEGTSNEAMFESLKKLSARLRVKIRSLEQTDYRGLMALVDDYNRAAKKDKRSPTIDLSDRMIDVGAIYRQFDGELLREVRTKNKSDVSRFQRNIQAHVDQGIPLLWSVMLGLLPEPNLPQGFGGHMRLIIGYNTRSGEVLYSDSWGPGHELKRMAIADAWTITKGLDTIEPL